MCKQAESLPFTFDDLPSELARFLDREAIAVLSNYTTCTQQEMSIREGMILHNDARVGDK